jgi:hypothetical protein
MPWHCDDRSAMVAGLGLSSGQFEFLTKIIRTLMAIDTPTLMRFRDCFCQFDMLIEDESRQDHVTCQAACRRQRPMESICVNSQHPHRKKQDYTGHGNWCDDLIHIHTPTWKELQ